MGLWTIYVRVDVRSHVNNGPLNHVSCSHGWHCWATLLTFWFRTMGLWMNINWQHKSNHVIEPQLNHIIHCWFQHERPTHHEKVTYNTQMHMSPTCHMPSIGIRQHVEPLTSHNIARNEAGIVPESMPGWVCMIVASMHLNQSNPAALRPLRDFNFQVWQS